MAALTDKMRQDLEAGLKVRLWPEETEREFHGFDELRAFLKSEVEAWSGKHDSIHQRFKEVSDKLSVCTADGRDERHRNEEWRIAVSRLQSGNWREHHVIYSGTKAGRFVLGLDSSKDGVRRMGAVDVVLGCKGDRSPSQQQQDQYLVYQLGMFEAWLELRSEAAVQRKVEQAEKAKIDSQAAFDAFVADCQHTWNQKETALVEEMTRRDRELGAALGKWNEGLTEQQEKWKAERTGEQEELSAWREGWEKTMKELEHRYRHKLLLEAPCRKWKMLEKSYTRQGKCWAAAAATTGAATVLLLLLVLYGWDLIPHDWSAAGIRASLLLLVVTSLLVYLVSLFARLALSSLHLARDATERRQMTYVFLGLLDREGFGDAETRTVVLQALFSRTDSGLLKGEHGFEMPLPAALRGMGQGPQG